MKKLILLITLLYSTTSLLLAQEVSTQQKTLLSKISATWCPPCGSWGWTLWEDIITDNEEKAILLTVHHSGDLETNTSSIIADNFNIIGQPRFYINNQDQNVSASSAATKRITIQEMVDNNYIAAPTAGTGLDAYLDGTELTVRTKTKFFQPATGDFYLGVYIVESGIVTFQSSIGDDAVHEKVLRTNVGGQFFGQSIMEGNVMADQEFVHEFTTTIDSEWDLTHVEVVALIWDKQGSNYQYINGNSTSEFLAPTSTSTLDVATLNMEVVPTISDQEVTVNINLAEAQKEVSIELINPLGQTVSTVYNGDLSNGEHTFQINRTDARQAGLYFVVLRNKEQLVTRRVIFE